MNKQIFLIILIVFIAIYSAIFYINNLNTKHLINSELKNSNKELQINFDITLQHNMTDALSINNFISHDSKILKIFHDAKESNETQRANYRTELYKILQNIYIPMKTRGVFQFQFNFPDNRVFLRQHKPNKHSDDLTDIRESVRVTNKTHKATFGFEQGRTSHAFRNIFPLYYQDKYIGCFGVSFGSEVMQENLSKINKIHSHFLVKKDLFDVNIWSREDMKFSYIPSYEHSDYMFAVSQKQNHKKQHIIDHELIKKKREIIKDNMKNSQEFSIYDRYKGEIIIISFLPIQSTQKEEVVAYIVSYAKNQYIAGILNTSIMINIVSFIVLFIIATLLYIQVLHINKIKIKSKEQTQLLSFFNEGDITLFKFYNNNSWSINYISDNVKRLTGYSTKDFSSNLISYKELINKDDLQIIENKIVDSLNKKLLFFTLENYRITTKDKKVKWVFHSITIIEADSPQNIQFLSYIIDITDIKRNEVALENSRKDLAQAQEDANIGSYKLDLNTNTLSLSDQSFIILQKNRDTYSPSLDTFLPYIHHNDISHVSQSINETITDNIKNEFDYRLIINNKTTHIRSTSHVSKVNMQGKSTEISGTIQDITSKKLLEIKLNTLNKNLELEVQKKTQQNSEKDKIVQEQSKLAAMGEMVGAIAHQWRQPLNSLNINIQNLDDDYDDGLVNKEFVDNFILKQSETIKFMSKTIDDFRNFFRIDKIKSDFSVLDAINATISIQYAQLKNHNISISITGEDFRLYTLESELKQVILNIITNAKDAILEQRIQDGKVTIKLEKKSIIIEDNAGGINTQILNRIFEPYFTTKEQGKGTGMGLYMSKVIIEQNIGGKLTVVNVDNGAKFTIEFEEAS